MPVADLAAGELITKQELLTRPEEQGVGIDPVDPYEIDDAISTERSLTRRLIRVAIHISDAGLLIDSPELIAQARTRGWSQYHEYSPADLMLDESVAIHGLSLNVDHEGAGAPAVTIGFVFNARKRTISEFEVYKSRLKCLSLSYPDFEERVAKHDKDALEIVTTAGLLTTPEGKQRVLRKGSWAKESVASFMLVANRLMADYMHEQGIPWLFRNHHVLGYDITGNDVLSNMYPHSVLFEESGMAWYGPAPLRHGGLGLDSYCHFTSPLRRFADLVNHLNLHASLTGRELPYSTEAVNQIAVELGNIAIARTVS